MSQFANRKVDSARAVIAALFMVFCQLAVAQTSSLTPTGDQVANFKRLLADATIQQLLVDGAKRSPVMVNSPCPEATFKQDDARISILKPLEFDSTGHLSSGAWKQSVNESGCGASRTLNAYVFARPDKSLGSAPGLPGTSRANAVLQKDSLLNVLSVAAAAAGESMATCKTQYVADTEFVGEDGDAIEGAAIPPWREIWTISGCTKRSVVPVRFIPDKTGTGFSVGPINLVKTSPLN